mmetsp:Transcript_9915/g.27672  ORF Transcript_9915/g.27672 Transcript_9915/m.27672 type:complete len:120 (-) Transcript_9915:268-627(-)|eukprot:CAMPEP_0194503932 /NCGR_PEP_ID=MMETSP0253-20130528/28663_1 /TAXON_ID=2966 /ORGANISM="Noctiluca scintillans" /LENGTH=119 /DNA_ID=CAMNT_0039346269 /DNA_START=76 /DNA_END=435 /DNA_ORIENTATION=-
MAVEHEPFEKRSSEARRILAKYPDRVPVVCTRAPRSNLPDIDKKKFLVPGTMVCGEFKYVIHKHLAQSGSAAIAADQTIFLFAGDVAPRSGALLSEVYQKEKSDDGFLYMCYSAENTLG